MNAERAARLSLYLALIAGVLLLGGAAVVDSLRGLLITMIVVMLVSITAALVGLVALVSARRRSVPGRVKRRAALGMSVGGLMSVYAFWTGNDATLHSNQARNQGASFVSIREVMRAEAAYAGVNGGYYDSLECLAGPQRCIPGYDGAAFLSDGVELARSERMGYRFEFYPGLGPARREPSTSPSSAVTYAYRASPLLPGRTGFRGFCGDDSGRICITEDGTAPPVREGRCATPCRELK